MARTTNVKIRDQHSILDGEATIYRVPLSGDVYQFRMYLRDERKHFRKSLRTRDLDSALTKAKQLALQILGKKEAGKKVFGISLQALVEQYIAFRERHVKSEDITPGRLVTIKSQLKHFIRAKGKDLKVSVIGFGSQGHAHALNLHDSGVDVTVGLREDSESFSRAQEMGLKVENLANAASDADVLMLLLPDQVMADVYNSEIAENIKEGDSLSWIHEELPSSIFS
jgi:hypothetical protein